MLNPEALEARARLEAHRQWDGQDPAELDALTVEITTRMYAAEQDSDIDELVDAAPKMTPADLAMIKRYATAGNTA